MASKKPGRYDHLIDELPTSFGEDPGRQAKIDVIKDEITNERVEEKGDGKFSSGELVTRYAAVRKEIDEQELVLSKLGLERDALHQMMYTTFEGENTGRVVLKTEEAVSIYREPHAKVIDPIAFRKWCVANGYENQLQLLWATTNSITKERLLAGEEEPDGVVAVGLVKVRFSGRGQAPKEEKPSGLPAWMDTQQ